LLADSVGLIVDSDSLYIKYLQASTMNMADALNGTRVL
jgi:hypothetical protein